MIFKVLLLCFCLVELVPTFGFSKRFVDDFNRASREGEDLTKHRNAGKINPSNCGLVDTDKIANGNITTALEYPFMALISYRTKEGIDFQCAGTLINDRYVLTAAHCVTGLEAGTKLIGVRLGEHNIRTDQDCITYKNNYDEYQPRCAPPVQDVGIMDDIIIHPEYQPSSRGTPDIALIKLRRPAYLTRENIAPICLPLGIHSQVKTGTVVGWGITEKRVRSDVLLKTQLDFISNDECSRTVFDITTRQFCAMGRKGQDVCSGDSGGPLLSVEPFQGSVKWVQLGIVAWDRCGKRWQPSHSTGGPVVFTSVTSQLKWILDNIN